MSGMPKLRQNHTILHHKDLPVAVMAEYWSALFEADTLKYRWCSLVEPTAMQALNLAESYFVLDIARKKIVAEFALENFTGKAGQVHFSMHPENKTELSINLATCVTDLILNEWKSEDGSAYLKTIFGLTAVENRAATMFIRKAGFKKAFILPSGTKYLNKVTDAVVTTKESRNG